MLNRSFFLGCQNPDAGVTGLSDYFAGANNFTSAALGFQLLKQI
jgi:hypothetical protein